MSATAIRVLACTFTVAVALAGCAVNVPRDDSSAPAPTVTDAPVERLMSEARAAQAAGDLDGAAANIERALRLDGRNPSLYLALARVRFAQGHDAQADGLARRARALAPRDSGITGAVDDLLAEIAKRSGGAGNAPGGVMPQ